MKQIPLDKLQPATPGERHHGVIVVRERPDGTYSVVGKHCLSILRELEQSGLVTTDIPIRCLVLGEECQES